VVLAPMYFLEDWLGRQFPPPITHPEMYYGFVGVTLAWQLVYLTIARDPLRYRPIMLLGVLAKGSFVIAVAVLLALGRVSPSVAANVGADLLFVILFIWAYAATAEAPEGSL